RGGGRAGAGAGGFRRDGAGGRGRGLKTAWITRNPLKHCALPRGVADQAIDPSVAAKRCLTFESGSGGDAQDDVLCLSLVTWPKRIRFSGSGSAEAAQRHVEGDVLGGHAVVPPLLVVVGEAL